MDRPQFVRAVRQALAHLYDQAFLQRCPLGTALTWADTADDRGLLLHRAMLEAIGALRPPARVPRSAAAWRSYLVLSLYYIEGRSREQVAEEVGISLRQFSREQRKGVDAVAGRLWERRQEQSSSSTGTTPHQALLDAELGRLSASGSGEGTPLAPTVLGVLQTLEETAAKQGLIIRADLPSSLPTTVMERVALRQALLSIVGQAVDAGSAELLLRAGVTGGFIELTAEALGPAPVVVYVGDPGYA